MSSRSGERIQDDVKFVFSVCLINEAMGKKFYAYTAIDEYSRWSYVETFYSSLLLPEHILKAFPYPV